MSAARSPYEFGVRERRTFEERLTARLLRRPFTDAQGRKRLYKFSRGRSRMWCGTTR